MLSNNQQSNSFSPDMILEAPVLSRSSIPDHSSWKNVQTFEIEYLSPPPQCESLLQNMNFSFESSHGMTSKEKDLGHRSLHSKDIIQTCAIDNLVPPKDMFIYKPDGYYSRPGYNIVYKDTKQGCVSSNENMIANMQFTSIQEMARYQGNTNF